MSNQPKTIQEILSSFNDNKTVFFSLNRKPLTYKGLFSQVVKVKSLIRSINIQKEDRVAIVLPNGVLAASVFLSIANCAISAPLNPNYKEDEFFYYMNDLKVKLLICDDNCSPSVIAAKKSNIPILFVDENHNDPAGTFNLEVNKLMETKESNSNGDDQALVLHTSGTTSKPKIVPLTQQNIVFSARNIAQTLKLNRSDVCINIMPLFHIHGLIAVILSSIYSGSSIFFTSGFNALNFFELFNEANPTWFSAVPSMHQAILLRASKYKNLSSKSNLRFIRSSSSSLPPNVMKKLENVFKCPIVEAYGMTEASHQMASNSINHGEQVAGSVGLEAGPKIMILKDGQLTRKKEILGEIVICGENVFRGYESNEKANKESFFLDNKNTWFRTGDQGKFDKNNFLYITGRLKEIINRGGEKISPREIDDVLLEHPLVEQAVSFSIPHKILGEDIGAAIVLIKGKKLTVSETQEFLKSKIANFKVPRKIVFLEELPKGSTGKVQRIGLAKKLGIASK